MTSVALPHARGASLERTDGTGACYLCDYGKTGVCLNPAVRGQKSNESFEAHFLDFPGLYWGGDRR